MLDDTLDGILKLTFGVVGLQEGNVSGILAGGYTADQRVIQFAAAAFNVPHISGAASMFWIHFICFSLVLFIVG